MLLRTDFIKYVLFQMQSNPDLIELGVECLAGFGTSVNPNICSTVATQEIITYFSTLLDSKHCDSVVMFYSNVLADN